MPDDNGPIAAVPTNVITGFLGVGKTTAILNLIERKPRDERWAVLVNEFGEIGVDGRLFLGRASTETGIYVEEVPGGCMCCASGLPMQIALNRLLRRARPHRLLIEPTGLGHPREVLQTLSKDYNREALALGRTLTLVDARNLADRLYTTHATFLQQIQIADVIIGNKADLYAPADHDALRAIVSEHGQPEAQVLVTQHGHIDPRCLEGTPARSYTGDAQQHGGGAPILASDRPFPPSGVISAVNRGEGFESIGWRFSASKIFDRDRLHVFLRDLDVERMKAVFITDQGVFGYNMTRDALTELELDDSIESRIEIIAVRADADWEAKLIACQHEASAGPAGGSITSPPTP